MSRQCQFKCLDINDFNCLIVNIVSYKIWGICRLGNVMEHGLIPRYSYSLENTENVISEINANSK